MKMIIVGKSEYLTLCDGENNVKGNKIPEELAKEECFSEFKGY